MGSHLVGWQPPWFDILWLRRGPFSEESLTPWMGQIPGKLAQRKGKCSEVPRGSENRVRWEPRGFVVLVTLWTAGEATGRWWWPWRRKQNPENWRDPPRAPAHACCFMTQRASHFTTLPACLSVVSWTMLGGFKSRQGSPETLPMFLWRGKKKKDDGMCKELQIKCLEDNAFVA